MALPRLTPRTITTEVVDRDTTIECDVVVIGSGAGGGIAAAVLAAAGLDVTVLERGGYRNESDFTHLESDAYGSMYLDGGLKSTSDGGVLMLAGSTLGGGTVINYTTSFRHPRFGSGGVGPSGRILRNVFAGDDFGESLTAVQVGLGVNQENGAPSSRDQIMEKGLRNLGWHVDEMPRNVDGCTEEDCGYCTMGCRIGAKRSTLATYLQDAAEGGARIVVDADVRRIDTDVGRVTGVVAQVGDHTLNRSGQSGGALSRGAQHSGFALAKRSRWPRRRPISQDPSGDRALGTIRGTGRPLDRDVADPVQRRVRRPRR